MTKKRRTFDLDMPMDDLPAPEVKSMGLRRGPMATAIGENADSLRERQSREAEIRAENDALAHEFVRLKRLGLITDRIPLEAVRSDKLVRDRSQRVDADLDDLKASIQAVGLSNPIRVEQVGQGVYELVEGWRRLSAYRELLAETGDDRFAEIPAGMIAKGETLDTLYRRMVDENMVRKDISFAEMANLARAYADDPATGCEDLDSAVNALFASTAPQKRSYIRRFAQLMRALEKVLEFPEAIPRALGLSLAAMIEERPDQIAEIGRALRAAPHRDADGELAILRQAAEGKAAPSASSARGRGGKEQRRAKTTLRLPREGGEVKCTATPGKIELQLDRDFSAVPRDRLEAAIDAFLRAL